MLKQFVQLYSETWNQAPLEDIAPEFIKTSESGRKMERYFKEQNQTWTTIVSREPDGTISGLTEIWHSPNANRIIGQGLIGASEKYRGRGLGKRIKAEMVRYIIETYPHAKVIETGNADSTNQCSLSTNK